MVDVSGVELAFLCLAALAAGTVDAIAGGGGLLTLPSLLAVGLPPHLALGTNKGQSVFGACAALVRFSRSGLVDGKLARLTFPLGLLGALVGAALVMLLRPEVLEPLVLGLLVAVALFLALRRGGQGGSAPAPLTSRARGMAAVGTLSIGAYDGFFGPGTGTFLIVMLSAVLGGGLSRASANAKVVNFASNLASVVLFASRGVVLWKLALSMAGFTLVGGWLGAHLAVKGGDRFVRRVVLSVVLLLAVKLGRDLFA